MVINKGVLYIVSTPIGNLGDVTYRAVDVLNSVDIIAAEDTRQSKKLLDHYQIQTKMISYHEHNEKEKSSYLIKQLLDEKNIALISDAGTPCLSDPGSILINKCIEQNIKIEWIPGPSAFLGALVLSGMDMSSFRFIGFLSSKSGSRKKELIQLREDPNTLIFYESPHRIGKCLMDLKICLGERKVCLARELTKKFETIYRGNISDVLDKIEHSPIKGEIVLVVEGQKSKDDWSPLPFDKHLDQVIEITGLNRKEAIKLVADMRGLTKSEIYNQLEKEK